MSICRALDLDVVGELLNVAIGVHYWLDLDVAGVNNVEALEVMGPQPHGVQYQTFVVRSEAQD